MNENCNILSYRCHARRARSRCWQRQARGVVGIGRAAVKRGDRNGGVVVDDRRRRRLHAAEDGAVAGEAGIDGDVAPGLDLRVVADIDGLVGVNPAVGAGADAGDRAVETGIGVVGRRHLRGRADIDLAGAEELAGIDVDRERGIRRHVGFGAAAGEEAGRGQARRIVGIQRVVGLDIDHRRRRPRIAVEAQDRPGADIGGDGLGDGRVAECRGTREHAAGARPRAAAGLVDDVVGDDDHVAARRVDDQVRVRSRQWWSS